MGITTRTVIAGERVALYNLMRPDYVHSNAPRARNYAAFANVFIRGRDIHRIADIAHTVKGSKDKATIIEIGAGTGFIAHLLAKTSHIEAIATDPNPQIEEYRWSTPGLLLTKATSGEAVQRFAEQVDIVLCTFPPKDIDCDQFARNLAAFNATVIILARDKELCSNTYGMRFPNYRKTLTWQGISTDKLPQMFKQLASRYQSGFYPNCEFEVYTLPCIPSIQVKSHTERAKMFQWETDIDDFCDQDGIPRYSDVPFFKRIY